MLPHEGERQIKLPKSYLDAQKNAPNKNSIPLDAIDEMQTSKTELQDNEEKAKPKKTFKLPVLAHKNKQHKKHPLLRRILTTALTVLVCLTLMVGTAIVFYINGATQNDSLWLDLGQLPHKGATIIYAQTDTGEWEEYTRLEATQQKIWIELEEMPEYLQKAFIAVEDKDFYKHSGVSWRRTIFAVLNELVYKISGSYIGGDEGQKQGASTIDQQLIKNLTRDDNSGGIDGYLRKIREIYRALKLDKTYEKNDILEAYLNVISFTGNTAGVQAASIKCFNKNVGELSLAECASIAAITKNPYRYDPVAQPENNLARRNYILYEMWQQGYITEDDYNTASAEPVVTTEGVVDVPETELTSYFTDKLIEDVSDALTDEYGLNRTETTNLLYNGGLRIYSTVDINLQSITERAMENGSSFFPQPGVKTKAVVYNDDGTKKTDESGNVVMEDVMEKPQAAMVTVDYTGALKAVVGGIGEKTVSRGFNRGTDAVRQVGSTMKPIGAYALAIENNKANWSSPFLDAPVRKMEDEATGEMKDWPANFSKTYSNKDILVCDALAQSINTIAVRVGEKAGISNIYKFNTNMLDITSFISKDKAAGPMILGSSTYGVTPYEMAGAYMMFGSGGTHSTLHSFTSIQTGSGKELVKTEVETKQVISSDTAYIMNRLLRGVMEGSGTAAGYSVSGEMDSIGKTGTTSDNKDFWFIGLTPYYCTATWYGYDSGFALNTANGTHAPTSAWKYVMQRAQQNLEAKYFPTDTSVVKVRYCTETGGYATDACPSTKEGYYKQNALPAACSLHVA